jgi:hypothetical protein
MDEITASTLNEEELTLSGGPRDDYTQVADTIKANFPQISMTAWQVLLVTAQDVLAVSTISGPCGGKAAPLDGEFLLNVAREIDDEDLLDEDVSDQICDLHPDEIAAIYLMADRYWNEDRPAEVTLASFLATISDRKEEEVFFY